MYLFQKFSLCECALSTLFFECWRQRVGVRIDDLFVLSKKRLLGNHGNSLDVA